MRRLVALALLATSCQRCGAETKAKDAGGPEEHALALPSALPLPAFAPLEQPRGYGLPSGCRFEGAVHEATLGAGKTRFIASRSLPGALALARGTGEAVEQAAFLDFQAKKSEAAPWATLDAPPLFERASRGWLAAWMDRTATGSRRALLWRGGPRAERLAEGDELELSDMSCSGDDCVVLSRLVRGSAAPGASWLAGKADLPAHQWRRVDLDLGGDEPWLPLGILDMTRAALSSGKHAALFEIAGDRAEKKQVLDVSHGAYDATVTPAAVVIAPGDSPERPCGAEEFPVLVLTAGGERHVVRTPAPPESVVARPLAKGALVAWVAPVSCQHLERRVVYLTRLDEKGAPASSPMAVADATGFAMSTRGDELALWLLSGQKLALLRARCP